MSCQNPQRKCVYSLKWERSKHCNIAHTYFNFMPRAAIVMWAYQLVQRPQQWYYVAPPHHNGCSLVQKDRSPVCQHYPLVTVPHILLYDEGEFVFYLMVTYVRIQLARLQLENLRSIFYILT